VIAMIVTSGLAALYARLPTTHAGRCLKADNGEEKEYSVQRGVHVNVQEGKRLKAGEPLMDGPLNPHDILAVLGEKELQGYLVNEIQEVYRLQGVAMKPFLW
jgi:hypothetical protein